MDKQLLQAAAEQALRIIKQNLPVFDEQFPLPVTENGVYPGGINTDWTPGFYTGECWLAYELTGDKSYRTAAEKQVESFANRLVIKENIDHHDMGFLYSPSCVAAYQLTGSETGRAAALAAADNLLRRFQEKGQFFQAWGELGAADNYRLIIDCLMNMPLLYWASKVTGDPVYREKAEAHTRTAVANLVRPDATIYHTYFMDPETGAAVRGVTAQGYKDDSVWARGQSWGVYGFALAYRYTKDEKCKELFRRVTDVFIDNLPADGVPYWDMVFGEGSDQPLDSSASAIAACGIYEMAPLLDKEEAEKYLAAADRMVEGLIRRCAVQKVQPGAGLLDHGVYCKASPYNTVKDYGVDECNLWGDYFYMEALVRALKDWTPYW